jgi:hypothetical protein
MGLFRSVMKKILGTRLVTRLRCKTRGLGTPDWGNLRRTKPFSESWGFDRGTPIDRYYLDKFLRKHSKFITGRVLEIQMPGSTIRYGHDLTKTDSVDIDAAHSPTYVCDLALSRTVIPSNSYDCFLLPNTLCVLKDIVGCLREALRIVRPGGFVLAATGTFVPLIPESGDYWRLTAEGWRELVGPVWNNCIVGVEAYGNCLSAVAAMLGLAAEELTPEELDTLDPRYPVFIGITCQKSSVRLDVKDEDAGPASIQGNRSVLADLL